MSTLDTKENKNLKAEAWSQMREILDKEMPQKKKRIFLVPFYYRLGAAMIAFGLIFYLGYNLMEVKRTQDEFESKDLSNKSEKNLVENLNKIEDVIENKSGKNSLTSEEAASRRINNNIAISKSNTATNENFIKITKGVDPSLKENMGNNFYSNFYSSQGKTEVDSEIMKNEDQVNLINLKNDNKTNTVIQDNKELLITSDVKRVLDESPMIDARKMDLALLDTKLEGMNIIQSPRIQSRKFNIEAFIAGQVHDLKYLKQVTLGSQLSYSITQKWGLNLSAEYGLSGNNYGMTAQEVALNPLTTGFGIQYGTLPRKLVLSRISRNLFSASINTYYNVSSRISIMAGFKYIHSQASKKKYV